MFNFVLSLVLFFGYLRVLVFESVDFQPILVCLQCAIVVQELVISVFRFCNCKEINCLTRSLSFSSCRRKLIF